jgi:methyl-accepting chemotaxis protein
MIPRADFDRAEAADARGDTAPDGSVALVAARLSREIVDVAGFLDSVDAQAGQQAEILTAVRAGADRIAGANAAVREAADTAGSSAAALLGQVDTSLATLRASGDRTRLVAAWVEDLDRRMRVIEETLRTVTRSTEEILDIARQVNILAINAKIEAARAGDAGRGFSVVAEAINALSRKTSTAAEEITGSIGALSRTLHDLRGEAEEVSREAASVRSGSQAADAALGSIAAGLATLAGDTRAIGRESDAVGAAGSVFGPAFDQMSTAITSTRDDIADARGRVNALIDMGEDLVQRTLESGGSDRDRRFVTEVQAAAAEIGQLFDAAIEAGHCSMQDLFDTDYRPITGSNPLQHFTRFTAIADRVLPEVQERLLTLDPKVVFCAAVDRNGYLPTHNRKFSHPQGHDPVWNAANCRNRRIFDDRVGLKAGRNTRPFLLQVYRRDMGGGAFALMRDLSAPIRVGGRHWGGLRLALAF